MRPRGGQPEPPITTEVKSTSPSPFDYTPIPIKVIGVTGVPIPSPSVPIPKPSSINPQPEKTIDSNPVSSTGKANKAEAQKQDTTTTNLINQLDVGIKDTLLDLPTITSNSLPQKVITQKYSPEEYRKKKAKREIEEYRQQQQEEEEQREQNRQKAPSYKISPPPNLDDTKVDDVINGSETGSDFVIGSQEEDKLNTPENLVQTPEPKGKDNLQDNDLAKIAALIAATPLLTNNGFSTAVEGALCNSADGGCLKSKLKDPITNNQNNLLDAINALGQGIDLSLLTTINDKLGDAIPGGIGGYLKKAWEVARIDKIINMANLLVATHNAAMLSRNLGETIGEVVNQGLNLLNIKDAEGNAIDVNAIVGNTVKGLMESLVPLDIRTNVSATWLKVNRIHTAAVSLASAITATKNAFLEVQEITADWVAKIGNTVQEQGIVEEDSYPWMLPGIQFKNPYQGFLNKLNNVEEIVDQASNFVNSAVELKDSVEQVTTSSEEVQQSIASFVEIKNTEEADKETESVSPDIANTDLIKHEE